MKTGGCEMKFLKDANFVARTSTSQETLTLLSELKECLEGEPKNADCPSQASKQATACDRILRACIHRLGEGLDCPAHLESLQALAEAAYGGYTAARLQYIPLYLEKLLYHLLRGVAAQGSSDSCLRFSDLLYEELLKNQPPQVPADDYASVAKSTFGVLWKSADGRAKLDKTPAELRAVLSTQLQAVRFLLLLENDASNLSLQEAPYFTSKVARHACIAAVTFEAQRSPLRKEEAHFLSAELFRLLVAPLLEKRGVDAHLAFQDCLCILELTVVRCRYLCKSGCFKESDDVLQQFSGYLRKSSNEGRCFSVAVDVLSAGVELNKVLVQAEGSVEPFFIQATQALNSSPDAQEPLLRVLTESCQLLVTPLYGLAKNSKQGLFNLHDILGISAFMESYVTLLQKLMDLVLPENTRQQHALKKQLYHYFQMYTTLISDTLQTLQGPESAALPELLVYLQKVVTWMLDMLVGLPKKEQAEYLDFSAYCISRLAYNFYCHKMYGESNSIVELFCRRLAKEEIVSCSDLPTEKLHNCFKLQVENYRKLGLLEEALQAVVLWLAVQGSRITEQMAEPISAWVKVKIDASKSDDLRLKTLKEGLEGYSLDTEVLMKVLLEELKAYKTVRADTGQERFNVICDLLDICSEGSSWVHERAVVLVELAQVLCYHDYSEQTECSALDSVHEALWLLDSVPKTPQNEEQLQDDKAQALLWLYICTIEDKMHESIKQEQRTRSAHARGQKGIQDLEGFETNDLNYENKSQDDKFLYLGIAFNLSVDSVQSKCLDDALVLWKQVLSCKGRIPAVRNVEQTAASLHIMAALYRMMGKPLQAIESYFLITALFGALEDSLGRSNALCQISKLLLHLECPSYAETTLKEAELCLQNVDRKNDSCLLTNQTLAVLRSKLCLANHKIEEGVVLLVEILQNPALQRSSKVWYLLRASALQLTAAYLGLPDSALPLALRQKLWVQGWKTPETALGDAHKLYRSILLSFSLIISDTPAKDVSEHQFVDHGDNLVQKWQVLADMFVCSESFVSLLGKIEIVNEAKAFCLEMLKISMRLQSIRWCARFLVLKSGLELQRGDLELCRLDLEQVLFLLESGTVFETKEEKGGVKIKPRKGRSKNRTPQGPCVEPSEEEQPFMREVSLEFVDTVSLQKKTLTTSPVLKPKQKKHAGFLNHPEACHCLLCSDVVLSAVCLGWLVTSAEEELASGNRAEGLHLLETSLKRCATVALRLSSMVACVSQGKKGVIQHQSPVQILDNLVAHIYVTLAWQSVNTGRPEKKLWGILESGLSLLSSKETRLLGFQYQRARLLLAKAVGTMSILASTQYDSAENLFSSAWSWKSPLSLHGNPEAKQKVEKAVDSLCTLPLKSKTAKQPRADQKAKSKRIQGTKPLSVTKTNNPFVPADSDSEAALVVVRPPVEHRTPAHKSLPAPRTIQHSAAKPRLKAPFAVFEESSPKLNTKLLKAPKVSKRTKSRIKVSFYDDSDMEDPSEAMQESQLPAAKEPVPATPKTGRRVASSRKASQMSRSTNSSDGCSQMATPLSRRPRGRGVSRRGKQQEETKEAPCEERTPSSQDEEKEVLRTIEEGPEASFEVLRGSDEEAPVVEEHRRRPVRRLNDTEEDQEVLRRDASIDLQEAFQATEKRGSQDPFNLHLLAASLDAPADSLSMDSVYDSLQAAFYAIGHYPPGALYSHLCRLMALCTGSRDPIATAYLVSESVSVTFRHQILTVIYKKLHKMKKVSVASALKQLEALSLQEGKTDSPFQHLSELQNLFEFSCPSPTKLETENFREQLQQIPSGVTVCILTLVSIQPETIGDVLLLTRLEKDVPPVTIQIQTTHTKVPVSAALRELDAILQKQKEISNLTDRKDWWNGRVALDKRMKDLTESLETHVLNCWKGALLPAFEDQNLAEEASRLQACLGECGCEEVDLALLKAMLIGSHLLAPQHVQCLAQGLNPAQPERAQNCLQEAVDKLGSRTGQASSGHLVLVLDKHLQKLPWENMPCLKNHSVTRLPSLRFLLSYSLTKKYQEETILNRGVNSSNAFYVLNPHTNLPGTEKMFKEWFQSEPGWTGVVGESPSADQVPSALEERDLYIYAGHGAGARFVDTILRVDCRAVALLFGCSSAVLAVQGNLEGTGAVLRFLMAGCPLVLGNLWDVTDRDIDRYMEALLKNWLKAGSGAPFLQYVIQSRDAPRLKYMIGAAPIAYGLPVSLQ
ncbi:separin [Lacerta agilis]|uniref:separin n=1 Tax=Lacerta agilis TaxID=80427 RepID=UPI0014192DE3|nr:separin [Lacerta agilis]